jgi:hypothetical protein
VSAVTTTLERETCPRLLSGADSNKVTVLCPGFIVWSLLRLFRCCLCSCCWLHVQVAVLCLLSMLKLPHMLCLSGFLRFLASELCLRIYGPVYLSGFKSSPRLMTKSSMLLKGALPGQVKAVVRMENCGKAKDSRETLSGDSYVDSLATAAASIPASGEDACSFCPTLWL